MTRGPLSDKLTKGSRRGNANINIALATAAALALVALGVGYGLYRSASNSNSINKSTTSAPSSDTSNCASQPFGCDESFTRAACPPIVTNTTIVMTASDATVALTMTKATYDCTV